MMQDANTRGEAGGVCARPPSRDETSESTRILFALLLTMTLSLFACGRKDEGAQEPGSQSSSRASSHSGKAEMSSKPAPVAQPDAIPQRGEIALAIEERLEGEATELNIAELLIGRELALHGFKLVAPEVSADYTLRGKLESVFHKRHVFEYKGAETLLEHQFRGWGRLVLTHVSSGESEIIEIPEQPGLVNGRNDLEDAKRDIRRLLATEFARRLVNGELLGHTELVA